MNDKERWQELKRRLEHWTKSGTGGWDCIRDSAPTILGWMAELEQPEKVCGWCDNFYDLPNYCEYTYCEAHTRAGVVSHRCSASYPACRDNFLDRRKGERRLSLGCTLCSADRRQKDRRQS